MAKISYILSWLRSLLYSKIGNNLFVQLLLKTKRHCPKLVGFVDVKQTHIAEMSGKELAESQRTSSYEETRFINTKVHIKYFRITW